MKQFIFILILVFVLSSASAASAQRTEITITFTEQFFDTVIDAMFSSGAPPEFSIGSNFIAPAETHDGLVSFMNASLERASSLPNGVCKESIRLMRETNGVRTAVRFREGKVFAPLAFNGGYNPPLVGCVEFAGWAESEITLQFDETGQRLIANARVTNVSLNGAGGVGGGLVARLVQGSIDKRINPVEIFKLEKVSFSFPIKNAGDLQMRAVGVRHEVLNGSLLVHVIYDLSRS